MRNLGFIVFVCILVASPAFPQPSSHQQSLNSVVNAERAFAKKSLEVGARAAFMMFFADDAVIFRPHPVKYKEAMSKAPPPNNPLETTLDWEPIWADVSSDGDFGYTTGPSVRTDHSAARRPPYYGFYFSFWKKQPTGEWKVVFDIGNELPGPFTGSREVRSPALEALRDQPHRVSAKELQASLVHAEKQFLERVNKEGGVGALAEVLDKDARIYRQKSFPIVGRDSIRAYFSGRTYLSSWEPLFCDAATSGDLGYTYGSYAVDSTQMTPAEKGYFLHGWKRNTASQWKLVAEILSPLPPEAVKPKQ